MVSPFGSGAAGDAARPAHVHREREQERPGPEVDGIEDQRLPVSDEVEDQPGQKPEQRHRDAATAASAPTTATGRRASRRTPRETLPSTVAARVPWPREPTTSTSRSCESA